MASNVLRVCQSEDGRGVKVNFEDNLVVAIDTQARFVSFSTPLSPASTSTPLRSPTIHLQPSDSKKPRIQMLDYLTSDLAKRLVPVLDQIVNPLRDQPIIFRALIEYKRKEKAGSFTAGYEIRNSLWSASSEDASLSGLVEVRQDGSVCVDSEESSSHLHLSADGTRITVTYPMCVDSAPSTLRFEHVWCTRRVFLNCSAAQALFESDSVPEIWIRPVAIAEKIRLERQTKSDSDLEWIARLDALLKSGLPRASELPLHVVTSPTRHPDLSIYESGWWTDPTVTFFPAVAPLAFEWTPEALYLPVLTPGLGLASEAPIPTPGLEAMAVVHKDMSVLETLHGGKFLRHGAKTYASETVPAVHPASNQSQRYRLAPLAAHLTAFRSALLSSRLSRPAPSSASSPSTPSSSQPVPTPGLPSDSDSCTTASGVRHVVQSDQGTFTAFLDGSVVIRFSDRTILNWNRAVDPHQCRIITKDGEARICSTVQGRELVLADYVLAATQFAHWAFTSPSERAEELRRRGLIQAEIDATFRGALLCALETKGADGVPLTEFPKPSLSFHGRGSDAEAQEEVAMPPVGLGLSIPPEKVGVTEGLSSWGRIGAEGGAVDQLMRRNEEILAALREELGRN